MNLQELIEKQNKEFENRYFDKNTPSIERCFCDCHQTDPICNKECCLKYLGHWKEAIAQPTHEEVEE